MSIRIPFLLAASISVCALLASTAAVAGSLSYTGTDCTVIPACTGSAFGVLTLPADITFTDTFSSGETSSTDDWTFTVPAAKTVATGSGVEFDGGGSKIGTIFSFGLYTSGGTLIVNGSSAKGGEVFTIPTQKLPAGSYYLKVVADGSYTGTLSATAVPLPASAWLMVSGVAGLLVLARRRRAPIASSPSAKT